MATGTATNSCAGLHDSMVGNRGDAKVFERVEGFALVMLLLGVYAGSCGLKTAFLGNGGRNAATIFSLRYPSSR